MQSLDKAQAVDDAPALGEKRFESHYPAAKNERDDLIERALDAILGSDRCPIVPKSFR
jgi:hypothetical protein